MLSLPVACGHGLGAKIGKMFDCSIFQYRFDLPIVSPTEVSLYCRSFEKCVASSKESLN